MKRLPFRSDNTVFDTTRQKMMQTSHGSGTVFQAACPFCVTAFSTISGRSRTRLAPGQADDSSVTFTCVGSVC